MVDNSLLTGTIMLETMWALKKQDLIDLIKPFVIYTVAKNYNLNQVIDEHHVLSLVKKEFGYKDMPVSIVQSVFKRTAEIKKFYGKYYYSKSLEDETSRIEKRRLDCDLVSQNIGKSLADYLNRHLYEKKYEVETALGALLTFFSRYGIYVGVDRMEEHDDCFKSSEEDYYIAQYIFENKEKKSSEYSYIIELVKGYFLETALYLQPTNSELLSATYKNVEFYYDTPFLIRLLGYKTDNDAKDAQSLHNALYLQRGVFHYFPQTATEINNILTAYSYNIGKSKAQTLEGLDAKQYTPADVERIRSTWQATLSSVFSITYREAPAYTLNAEGGIDSKYIIDEKGLNSFLAERINYKSEEARNADMESILAIHRLRNDAVTDKIEHCKAIFVTTNVDLARETNKFYADNVNKDTFPILITDSSLSALTWIKTNHADSSIPETHLLRNAYMATQPTPALLAKFDNVLDKMSSEGRITEEVSIAIRESHFVNREILFASFGGEENINEDFVSRIEDELKKRYSEEVRVEEQHKAQKAIEEKRHEISVKAYDKARHCAEQKSEFIQKFLHLSARVLGVVFFILALCGTLVSFQMKALLGTTISMAALLASILSIYDVVISRKNQIEKMINRIVDAVYRSELDKKLNEYDFMIDMADKQGD